MSSRQVKKVAADVRDKIMSSSEEVLNGRGEVSNSEGEEMSNGEGDDEYVECPVCHIHGHSCQWVHCDNCNVWYHTHCTDVDPDNLPDIHVFYCFLILLSFFVLF